MSMSRKVIATVGPDLHDCTVSGYVYTLYRDGHVAAEYHTRWQGSTTGARYVTDPDALHIDPADPEGSLSHWIANVAPLPVDGDIWRQTRKGEVIQ